MLRRFLYWLMMAVAAVVNGAIGEFAIQPWAGETATHVYKTVVLVVVIVYLSWRYMKRVDRARAVSTAWLAGCTWLALSVIFEFGFGHYVIGDPWEKLFAAYRIWEGQIWILVLLAELLAPVYWARRA